MLSTTIKRSVAALGVVAGLLAAVPASAQILDGPVLANAKAGGISGAEMMDAIAGKAPASPTSEVFTSVSNVVPLHGDATTSWTWHEAARNGVVTNNNDPDTMLLAGINFKVEPVELMSAETRGTQVGSEGVRAPTGADQNLRGEAIDIIP